MSENFIPFAVPDITEAEKSAVVAALDSGWITTGPRTKDFENEFAARVGNSHAVAVNSCTAALHLALEAIGVGPGDEVIVPTLTFAATAEVVRYLGARPVLVDVRASDHNIDPSVIARAVTSRTKAILPVHFAGQACEMDEILEIARSARLVVIEDGAHAFPSSYRGRAIGAIGDITCFSFYATKTITTGEGGMAVTGRPDWADRMRIMSLHGITKDAWKRYSRQGSWYYEIEAPGYKYNMTDIAAAMGSVQLRRADEMLEKRRTIARAYREALAACDALEVLETRSFEEHSWHLFVVKLVESAVRIGRDEVIGHLRELGIGVSVHFIPLHVHPYYRATYGHKPIDLPIAWDVYQRSISLPIYSKMSRVEVDRVVSALLDVIARYRR